MGLALVGGELLLDQSDQVGLGPGPEMGNDFGRRDRSDPQAFLDRAALDLADQKAGGEQIAGAGGVDDAAA